MSASPLLHRLLALWAAGWLLFNFPLLQLWLLHPAGLFGLWALLIGVLAWLMEGWPQSDAG